MAHREEKYLDRVVRATPEDARLIWEAIDRRGIVPTDQKVVDEMQRSGRFLPITRTTILRWRKAGWNVTSQRPVGTLDAVKAFRDSDPEQHAALLNTLQITVKDMVAQYADMGDMNLMRAAARHCYANAMVLSNMLQRRKDDPELNMGDAGKMAKAIADSVKSANQAMAILVNMGEELVRTMRIIEGTVVDNSGEPVAPENVRDDYGDVFAPFRLPAIATNVDDDE